jgi:hypothetical protein
MVLEVDPIGSTPPAGLTPKPGHTKGFPMGTSTKSAQAVLTSETLVLTKDQRQALESAFVETQNRQSARARALMPYHRYTTDQIVAAMYASADKTNDELHITRAERSTMARSLAVVKAWVHDKADTLVEKDSVDHCLQALTQIAGYTPGEMVKYALKTKDGKPDGYGVVTVHPNPKAKETFDPYEVKITHGSGEKVMAAIIGEFMEHRVEVSPEFAVEWLTEYRNAVRYAANEYRRTAKAHNKRAADSRKGTDDGSTKKSKAKNAGGTGGKAAKKAEAKKARKAEAAKKAAAKPRTAAQRPLSEANVADLLTHLALRVADVDTAITVAESRQKDDLDSLWEKRMTKITVGKTAAEMKALVKGKGKKATVKPVHAVATEAPNKIVGLYAITPEARRQNLLNKAQMPLDTAQCNRALLAERKAGHITDKRRKEIMMGVMDGTISPAKFAGIMAKITAKADMAAVGA